MQKMQLQELSHTQNRYQLRTICTTPSHSSLSVALPETSCWCDLRSRFCEFNKVHWLKCLHGL